MKTRIVLVGMLAMGFVAAGMASAQEPGVRARLQDRFRQADVNADGTVTFEEMKTVRSGLTREDFNRLDRNGDGVLSPADRPAGGGPGRLRELAQAADKNGDKQLTYEEIVAVRPQFPREAFDRLDANKDGKLSKEDRPQGLDGPAGSGGGPGRVRELMQAADKNQDKQLTYEEIVAVRPQFPREAFDRMDRNADGVLSKEDRAATQ